MIKADSLTKIVPSGEGELVILDNVSLSIETGRSLAIVGPSGAGKSTLLGLLAGLDTPTSGDVWLEEHQITAMDEEGRAAVRADLVGFVFQTFQLLPSLTALENVALPLELRGESRALEMSAEYLGRVGLADRTTHYPRQLSGGEQQRVSLARAFACRPKILFADEPTGNLDARTGSNVSDLLFKLNAEEGATLVLVTHEDRLAERCDTRLVIDGGELVKAA